MNTSFTRLYIHMVFSTQCRIPIKDTSHREELLHYIAGIIQNHKSRLYCGKVMPEHVHLLIGLHAGISVSELVQKVKAGSSKHINDSKWFPFHFQWNSGYGAFSCSQTVLPDVTRYIENQESHHQSISHKAEYIAMLEKAGIKGEEIEEYLPQE